MLPPPPDSPEPPLPGIGARPEVPVGVIPGGGGATRLAPLPFSKELLPVGFRRTPHGPRPRVVSSYLLEGLRAAGARRVYWLLDKRKADVLGHFGSGSEHGVQLAYVPVEASPSVVHTLGRAFEFLDGEHVVFGFPDIVFEPEDAVARIWQRLRRGSADVVLGAVPAAAGVVADRVELDPGGALLALRVKPLDRPGDPAWIVAAWTPRFTRFLRRWLAEREALAAEGAPAAAPAPGELYLGHAIAAAHEAGLSVEVETFQTGHFIDAGTPEGLAAAIARHGALPSCG